MNINSVDMSKPNNSTSQHRSHRSIKSMVCSLNYYILLSAVWMVSLIPFGVLHMLSDVIYFPLYYVVRYRRRVVRKNLV